MLNPISTAVLVILWRFFMRSSNKLVMPLLLALSISSTFPANPQMASNGGSYFQGLYAALSSVVASSFKICNAGSWVKNNSIKTACACGALVALVGYQAFTYYRDQQANDYPDQQSDNLLATLLNNPSNCLNHLCDINEQFESACNDKKLMESNYADDQISLTLESLIQSHEKKSPIFLLSESKCLLTRTLNPQYREQFEERVVGQLVAKLESSTDTVQYVGFGSGGMYQDLIILCKALESKPRASLSIHLIDCPKNQSAEYREGMEYIKKMNQVKYIKAENRTRQFTTFLQKAFPHAQITLQLHKNDDAYLDYIKQHNLPYPDVICAADIDSQPGITDYVFLTKTILEKKPDTDNTLLEEKISGQHGNTKANLITISLNKNSRAEKHEFTRLKFTEPFNPHNNNTETIEVFLITEDI